MGIKINKRNVSQLLSAGALSPAVSQYIKPCVQRALEDAVRLQNETSKLVVSNIHGRKCPSRLYITQSELHQQRMTISTTAPLAPHERAASCECKRSALLSSSRRGRRVKW